MSVHYPEHDEQLMADSTRQRGWIATIGGYLDAILPDLVAGDLLWYPVEGDPKTRIAPGVLVALGRPKGERGAYLQWKEGGVAPQVVFEILSPSNTLREMIAKATFYAEHGAQELYVYDPSDDTLLGWRAAGGLMRRIDDMHGFTSPLLGVRFDLSGEELQIFGPSGERLRSFTQLIAERDALRDQRDVERARAEAAELRLAVLEAELAAVKAAMQT